jgi:hypothetical protein
LKAAFSGGMAAYCLQSPLTPIMQNSLRWLSVLRFGRSAREKKQCLGTKTWVVTYICGDKTTGGGNTRIARVLEGGPEILRWKG